MIRYFYYLILLNMLANIVLFVPGIFISRRFEGSILSVAIAVPIGYALIQVFMRALSAFPGQGFPEILRDTLPNWLGKPILVLFIGMWFSAGSLTLVTFTSMITTFINPDIPSWLTLFSLLCIVALIARLSSDSVLYTMEILLVLSTPMIMWILYKSLLNPSFRYDAVFEIVSHFRHWPTLDTLSAGTYIFTGYVNMIIFNRLFGPLTKLRFLWAVPIVGCGVLLTSFLIPIGMQGTIAVGDYTFIWSSTTDSMRIEFGIVERVMFIFILLYSCISVAGTFIHWHVGLEMTKGLLPGLSKSRYFTWIAVGFFSAVTLIFNWYMDHHILDMVGRMWIELRFISEMALVALIFLLARRKRRLC
ncbi:GerAB/ArcD/ProY family transporter [Paenibacillus athensensis]|uniref:Uncharacterized protein n=1 Tax=Paenibacillus athensensis TaxID=1967502 RepID=A0A4Y8PTH9_9BACL|nr:GerAB/ArcD/ProY family transporter [Paenibacillus athensensis]MCD1257989.1 GerAB/ArcD/ProY family transporter [Paenibacillus athensensis]